MPPYIARIGWSDNRRWTGPTLLGGSGETPGSFRRVHGYGYEDWFFDFEHIWSDGYVYGMVQPVLKSRVKFEQKVLDLLLYTIGLDLKRYYLGRLSGAEVLTETQAKTAYAECEKRGWLAKRQEQVAELGLDSAMFAAASALDMFLLRYRPQDWRPEPGGLREAGSDDYICGHGHNRYLLVDTQALKPPVAAQWAPPGSTALRPTVAKDVPVSPGYSVDLLHNRLQNRLFSHLSQVYPGAVCMEKAYVDIWVDCAQEHALIEVKSSRDAVSAVREALGQLLEYAWLQPGPAIAQPYRLVVAAPAPRTPRLDDYLATLRKECGLALEYLEVQEDGPLAWPPG